VVECWKNILELDFGTPWMSGKELWPLKFWSRTFKKSVCVCVLQLCWPRCFVCVFGWSGFFFFFCLFVLLFWDRV
jgi:hypothetical protein